MWASGRRAGDWRAWRPRHLLRCVLICSTALAAPAAWADDPTNLIYNNYGSVGLIDMPSARMAPDGTLSAGADFTKNTERYSLGFQFLPWLETDFRYTGLTHFDPSYPVYWDRSFAVKARLWQEGDVLPTVAVGVDDLVGTGIYSGEYLVASKQFGAVDATLGMGWGRLASTNLFKNPLAQIDGSFATRSNGFETAGGAHFNIFFHGPNTGLFGGLTWSTPIDGLSLIAEYSSDEYRIERQRQTFTPSNQVNIGASYQVSDTLNVGVDYLYGQSFGVHFALLMDPVHDPFPRRLGPEPPPVHIRTHEEQQAAIQTLLAARTGRQSPERRLFVANNALVDALWQGNSSFDNVALNGSLLSLSIAHGDPSAVCRDAAVIAGQHSLTIRRVRVSEGPRHATCAVSAEPALIFANSETDIAPGATALASLATGSPVLTIDAADPQAANRAAAAKIRNDAGRQQIIIQTIAFGDGVATVYYSNIRYFSETDALNRLIRVMMADAPPDIERFRLIATLGGIPQREFDILRGPAERSVTQTGDLDIADTMTAIDAPMHNPVLAASESGTYPRISTSIFPQFRQELFDPSNPFGVQFLAGGRATAELFPGFSVTSEAELSLWDDFNVNRAPGSDLPHVRTDFLKYFTKGKNGIGDLEADYRFRLAPNVYATLKAGYLESMFAGFGGEVLWRPDGWRWALGADLYDVEKRDFNRLFGLMPYRVVTGHVSLYYASPWYGLNFELRAGQYLAGDRGLTVQMTRRFADTGVEIGAFFTKTNVSAQQFGEGSFDKGIIIRIPLGWVAPINTQEQLNMDIRPVQRDGGQPLNGDATLYTETQRTSDIEMSPYLGKTAP